MGIFSKSNIKEISNINNIQEQGGILLEASDRTYKCPYCDYRGIREDLVYHIDEDHENMIPKDYTAARIVFNMINHKEHGTCIICKKETLWNENTYRYERLCDKKECYDKYREMVDARMVKVYGKKNLLGDAEHQKKMLAGRKISGEYKFQDKGVRTYTGSYEQKLFECLDKVYNFKSKDILAPGPTIEYEYKGETHQWITDVYLVPFNLIIEVKDGGDNPNTRPMDDYRAKQIAKEKAIVKLNQYNYIRLTDNNFQQLLLTMVKIKKQLTDDMNENEFVIDINESVQLNEYTAMGSMNPVCSSGNDSMYIIPYYMNNTFVGTAVSTDKYLDNMYISSNGKIGKRNVGFLKDFDFSIFKYIGENTNNKLKDIIIGKEVPDNYIYNLLSDKSLLNPRQLYFDENFIEVENPYIEKANRVRCIIESLNHQHNKLIDKDYSINLLDKKDISIKESLLQEYNKLDILQDINGYYVYNECTDIRSKSYSNINDISNSILDIVEDM